MGSSVMTLAETARLPKGTRVHLEYNRYLDKTWARVYRKESKEEIPTIEQTSLRYVARFDGDRSVSTTLSPEETALLGLETVQVL